MYVQQQYARYSWLVARDARMCVCVCVADFLVLLVSIGGRRVLRAGRSKRGQ